MADRYSAHEELCELTGAVCDATISPEELVRLEAMLGESRDARRVYHEYTLLHAELRWRESAVTDSLRQIVLPVLALEPVSLKARKWRLPLSGRLAAAMLCGVLVAYFALLAVFVTQRQDTERPLANAASAAAGARAIAKLTASTDCVWDGVGSASVPSTGDSLYIDELLSLEHGLAEIMFADGARVHLEGPARFTLESSSRGNLHHGKLVARVSPRAVGFTIQTPTATVVDLGTEFGVEVDRGKQTNVHVIAGKVRLLPRDAAKSAQRGETLQAGEARRVASGSGTGPTTTTVLPFDSGYFLASQGRSNATAVEASSLERWRQQSNEWRKSADLLAYFTFDGPDSEEPRRLVNRARATAGQFDAKIHGARWQPGRWPGKWSLEFNSNEEWAEVDIPGEYKSLTFVTTVRLRPATQRIRALWATDDWRRPGQIVWQFTPGDGLQFAMHPGPVVSGGSAVKTEEIWQWLQVAAVYDADNHRLTQFVNGQEVAQGPFEPSNKVLLGPARIGNWDPKEYPFSANDLRDRYLGGCMDELFLFRRSLAVEEIRRLAR